MADRNQLAQDVKNLKADLEQKAITFSC